MKLSIIIPVFNEENTLEEIVDRVFGVNLDNIEKEVIISDDGSRDQTHHIIQKLQGKYPGLIAYHSPINLGKGAAVRLGMALASGDIITIQDADLELDPQDYVKLIAPLLNHEANVVYGSRFRNAGLKINRTSRMANRLLTFLTNLFFHGHLSDMETAYKMFLRETIDGMHLRSVRFDFEPEITANFLRRGYKIVEVPITYNPRTIQGGKKISWIDGFDAIMTLIRCRLF